MVKEQGNVIPMVENEIIGETKADAFRRLAGKRLATAIEKIQLIGNCANVNQYEYTPAQIEKVRAMLQTEVDFMINKFSPKSGKAKANIIEL